MNTHAGRTTFLVLLSVINVFFIAIIAANVVRFIQKTTRAPIIMPTAEASGSIDNRVAIANSALPALYDKPLTLIVGINNANRFLTLSPDDLKRYTTIKIATESADIIVGINHDVFFPDLIQALSVYGTSFNPALASDAVGAAIRKTLTARFHGISKEPVSVGIDSGPNTEGNVADRYIEIDISQQKLFTFRNGKLVKAYRVSTGKDYPTPTGRFTILNKTGLGFSSIYNVWMPYWMGFSYSKELHAYFGIHELPYYYADGGTKIQRPRDFIGAPNTGGCVALDIGDAKEVYNFADIGTPVVIYQ